MQYTINEFRHDAFKKVYEVYEVFQNYFGESYTDLQNLPDDEEIAEALQYSGLTQHEGDDCYEGSESQFADAKDSLAARRPFILVWWPKVKITNEHNRFIYIQDLYAKIILDSTGCIPTEESGFLLNRSTYPMEQWVCNYLHSHISSIPKESLTSFQRPCLGTGPIKATINSLRTDLNEGFDDIKWMLFCEELSRYVTVESLAGVPYKHLENVHISSVITDFNGFYESDDRQTDAIYRFKRVFSMETLRDFILYYLQNGHLAINYQQGAFVCGMSYFDYMIDISNSFIDFFNSRHLANEDAKTLADKCFTDYVLYHTVTSGDKFLHPSDQHSIPDVSSYIGRRVCDFKGQEVKLSILGISEQEPQQTTVLSHGLAMYILNNILKIINYRYTNEYSRQQGRSSEITTNLPATTHQRVFYL